MTTKQPDALRLAEMLTANEWPGHVTIVSYAQECVAGLLTQHARITELESQLAQRFDAADVATAAAQGFRDGVASLSANVGEPRNAIDRDRIREIFMAYGFTVKEGQTDLKQYVYDAADALLRAARKQGEKQ